MLGKTILLVEDNFLIADLVQEALREVGARVCSAPSVELALQFLQSAFFDAAVLDVDLQGESSMPVADRLQAMAIPFVFFSGGDGSSVSEEHLLRPLVRKLGMTDLLVVLAELCRGIS
ncbi:MAG: response regulator [Proteobacteria bacterium]|nr:response regulator [Pseudomonadota bacterium]